VIVAVSGSRGIKGKVADELVKKAFESFRWKDKITKVIHGAAEGIDQAADSYCRQIWVVEKFPADWERDGKTEAGMIRNLLMLNMCDAVIAIWDGVSPGTKQMIESARQSNVPVFVHLHSKSPMKGFDL
jgi:hypothetical protein